jgi:DNA polymerase
VTGEEKKTLANFLDLTRDYLNGAYRSEYKEYAFKDDAAPAPQAAAPNPAPQTAVPGVDSQTAATVPGADSQTATTVPGADSPEAVAADIARCTACRLCSSRTNTVPGEGVPHPLVLVIGEGPGADEDASGRPFVGRAGQLLDRVLDSKGKIGLSRTANCFIANMVKCRPPGNRNPLPDEIQACAPFLARQIALLRPLLILAAGSVSARALLNTSAGVTKLRGSFSAYTGALNSEGENLPTPSSLNIPLLPTFHPSALLRDESLKVPVWEDMKMLRATLCELDSSYAASMQDIPL